MYQTAKEFNAAFDYRLAKLSPEQKREIMTVPYGKSPTADYYEALLVLDGMPAELEPIGDVSLSTSTEAQHDICEDYSTDE